MTELDDPRISLHPGCELVRVSEGLSPQFRHLDTEKLLEHPSSALIMATGYQTLIPACFRPLRPYLQFDKQGNFKAARNYFVDEAGTVFIQNAEQATHGFNAADLSLGPYRNAVILNTILEKEVYRVEKGVSFQRFGLPVQL